MKVKEFKNKTIVKSCDEIIVKTASGFDLLEYPANESFVNDTKYNENDVADFLINKKNILIIYIYEF